MYKRFGKRLIDTVLSLIALVILSPLLLITALAVKISSPGPVLFKQQRLGLHGKVFTIYKFRSMTDGAEHTGSGVYSGKGDARVTKVGKIIRATSIDELPQLINIIVGDMAIIGPRRPLTLPILGRWSSTRKNSFICLTFAPASPAGRRYMAARA